MRLAVELIHNTTTTVNVKWISATSGGAPTTVTSPLPSVDIPVAVGDLTFGLLLKLDVGVNVVGDGFFEIEAFPGNIV